MSAKTMPCPNKLGSLPDTFAASVRLNRSLLGRNRDTLALNDRKRQERVQKCRAGGERAPREGHGSDKWRRTTPTSLGDSQTRAAQRERPSAYQACVRSPEKNSKQLLLCDFPSILLARALLTYAPEQLFEGQNR